MPLIINHTELDVPKIVADLRDLVAKAPKRENIETLSELIDQVDELFGDLEAATTKVEELRESLSELNDHYETWEDEENDRDTRMDARENIESISTDIDATIDDLESYTE